MPTPAQILPESLWRLIQLLFERECKQQKRPSGCPKQRHPCLVTRGQSLAWLSGGIGTVALGALEGRVHHRRTHVAQRSPQLNAASQDIHQSPGAQMQAERPINKDSLGGQLDRGHPRSLPAPKFCDNNNRRSLD